MARRSDHGVGGYVIEADAGGVCPELSDGLDLASRFPVRTRLHHGAVGVGDRQDPGPGGQHRPADGAVIAGAVHPIVAGQQGDTAQRMGPVEEAPD